MDLSQYAASGWDWLAQSLSAWPRRRSYLRGARSGEASGATWGSLLNLRPAIVCSWPSVGFPLGIASAIGPWLSRAPIEFLVMPSWAWELPEVSARLLEAAALYVRKHRRHRISFLCNTPSQEAPFAAAGWSVTTLNSNMFVDDCLFRPLPDIEPIHDAIYNARLSPDKRVDLAVGVERLCLIYFFSPFDSSVASFHATHARLQTLMPGATFLNRLTGDGCEQLDPAAVNRAMNRSRVGLCLSAVEGQMRASMEYLMAGLPVVSTPSIGGRDYFFDADYCAVVEPDPRQIRDAVAAMIQRNIPREHIRERTMRRVERERRRFVEFVQGLIERCGGGTDFAAVFPDLLRNRRLKPWINDVRAFAERVNQAMVTGDLGVV